MVVLYHRPNTVSPRSNDTISKSRPSYSDSQAGRLRREFRNLRIMGSRPCRVLRQGTLSRLLHFTQLLIEAALVRFVSFTSCTNDIIIIIIYSFTSNVHAYIAWVRRENYKGKLSSNPLCSGFEHGLYDLVPCPPWLTNDQG